MDEDEIRNWSGKYDENYADELHTIERNLNRTLNEQQYITQEQLREVIRWKLDNQRGRRNTNIERMLSVPESFIHQISEAALSLDDPPLQLKTLTSIPGIGSATATVVLTFHDPTNYAVGDRYIVDILFGEDRQMRITDYSTILKGLSERNPGDFDLRTIEKAYYQRYRDEHGL